MEEKDLVYTLALFSNFQALQDWKLLLVLVVFLILDVTLLSIFTLLPAAWLNGRFQMVRSKYLMHNLCSMPLVVFILADQQVHKEEFRSNIYN